MSKRKTSDYVGSLYDSFNNGGSYRNNSDTADQNFYALMYTRILSEMCVNRFKWLGLPDSVNERFLEQTLFRQSLAVFYKDFEYDQFLALRGSGVGPMNMYDDYTQFRVYGNSSFVGKTMKVISDFNPNGCVPIWANANRQPDWDIVVTYAARLARIDRSIDITAMNMRKSKVVVADENTRLTATNINNEIEKGASFIAVNQQGRQLIADMANVDIGVDKDYIDRLQIARTRMWNDCMGLLGLNNANQDKKERLVAAEVSANDDQVSNMRAVNLMERKRAIREINKRFGLSVDVKFNVDLPTIVENTGGVI